MCRMIILSSSKRTKISHVVSEPSHSLISQSYNCKLRAQGVERRTMNADGYGIGWYDERDVSREACILTSVLPAWGCGNLDRIVSRTASKLIFAHIRAMTTGTTSDINCHPFQYGSLMFMHNGSIGSWSKIKRPMANMVSLKYFMHVKGNTDSELAFALFLTKLEEAGHDPAQAPPNGFGQKALAQAIRKTIRIIDELVAESFPESPDTNLLNFAVTDGDSIVTSRYVNNENVSPSSLYYCQGSSWIHDMSGKDFVMDKDNDQHERTVVVASEPLTNGTFWTEVPRNSILAIEGNQVTVTPIEEDEEEAITLCESLCDSTPDFSLHSKFDSLVSKTRFKEEIYEVTESCCSTTCSTVSSSEPYSENVKRPPLSTTLSNLRQTFQVRLVKYGKKQKHGPVGLMVSV